MKAVQRWLDRQAARERARISLADAFLAGAWPAYARYRLRFFAARYVVGASAHAVKLGLLYQVFSSDHFGSVVAIHAVVALAAAFWWGALEELREQVRELFRTQRVHHVDGTVAAWLRRSLWLGGGCLLLAGAVGTALAATVGLGPAGLYVVVMIVRLALELPVRCYHSGLFAVRRVYRPLPVMLTVDLLGLASLLALWPWLGAWAFGTAAAIAGLTAAGCTVHYTRRAYWFVGLHPERSLGAPARRAIPLRRLWAPGLASLAMSVDGIVFALIALVGHQALPLAGWIFALAPSLRATVDWAKLFYFDLKKLEIEPFRNLRRVFARWTSRLAWVLGFGLCALGWLIVRWIVPQDDPMAGLLLAPLFVAQAVLAAAQVRAFTEGSYARVVLSFALLLATATPAFLLWHDQRAVLALAAGCVLATLMLKSAAAVGRGTSRSPVAITAWLHELSRLREPVRVRSARVAASARARARRGGIEPGRREAEQLGRRLAHWLGGRGLVALPEPGRVTWFERIGRVPAPADVGALARESAGLLTAIETVEEPTGQDAVDRALDDDLLGAVTPCRDDATGDEAALARAFRESFADGLVCTPGAPGGGLPELTADERHAVLADAVAYARDLRPRRSGGYEISALCARGELRTIFAVPTTADRDLRRAWHAAIASCNLWSSTSARPARVLAASAARRRRGQPPAQRVAGRARARR